MRKGGIVVEEQKPEVRQTTIVLPYFEYEIPILYLEDKTPYIPVVELCRMLGLRADAHIPRWRKLILWSSACKLPYQTAKRGRRLVWCLQAGAMLSWFCCFDWSLVHPERRIQLEQATDVLMEVWSHAHQKMIIRYKTVRRQLFEFLTTYADIETGLARFSPSFHVYLNDFDLCIQWEDLIHQGKTLISDASTHARKMLDEQMQLPVIDAYRVDTEGAVIEECALPLFPIVEEADVNRFYDYLERLSQWQQELLDFLELHGIVWNREQKKWYLA